MARSTSVIGIYENQTTVSDAIDVLHKAGYRATDMSVLSSDNRGSRAFAHEKHTKAPHGGPAAVTNRGEAPARQTVACTVHEAVKCQVTTISEYLQ